MSESKKHFLADIEEVILSTWDKEKTFEKSLENRKGRSLFVFYDGPPFANGIPHYGHLEQTTIKDTITRYKTMSGFYVPRRLGWDTHGLPIEYAIEKQHGFKNKKEIIEYGIAKFNKECRDSVFTYKDIWEKMFYRVGRWADNSQTYATFDDNYMESVWWVFKTIYDKGLVYKDFRSSPYCPRCATPLSNFELNQGYQDNIKDPSLFVKFKVKDEDVYLLGWTTTPWSLPGNAAIAVKSDANYVYVKVSDESVKDQEVLIVARDRLGELNIDTYTVLKEVTGKELIGIEYEPLFELSSLKDLENKDKLFKVWGADFVSIEEGTGVLHVAPAFGEDDLLLAKQQNIPVLLTVDENGHVVKDNNLPEQVRGKFFKAADDPIIEHLTKRGLVYAAEHLLHTYPFCWRCDTPLLYYATDSWLVKVTDIKDRLVANNEVISWVPDHIREGRFGQWLAQARDWAISRNRFWGAPIPIWITEDGEITVVGSIKELKELAVEPEKIKDLHRPYIDDVIIKTKSGKLAKRINEVFDVWFESGSMPYGQIHYPFENKIDQDKYIPADFIAEAIDQTRGWFYTLHVLATALFDKPAFNNVICSGWIVAADGQKLSKRKKNYAPMDEVFDQYGVDTLRFFISSSPLMNGEDTRFSVDFLRDVQRKIFMTLLNTFNFYKMYADVDKWNPPAELTVPNSDNTLDKWILSRINQVITQVTTELDNYRLDKAARPIVDLLDDLSNWYVRRSRRRFWKSQNDKDKESAYATLHYCLLTTCQLLAPFAPFIPDYIWRSLVTDTNLPSSVHLSDWPDASQVDLELISKMDFARDIITKGLSLRAASNIKVRQPLNSAKIYDKEDNLSDEYIRQIVIEELNVKQVKTYKAKKTGQGEIELDTNISHELELEGVSRELVRFIQNARKEAGLNVDDRINLTLLSEDKNIKEAVELFKETIASETLAKNVLTDKDEIIKHVSKVKVNGQELTIGITKA